MTEKYKAFGGVPDAISSRRQLQEYGICREGDVRNCPLVSFRSLLQLLWRGGEGP
jgi:hypothetical protein